MKTADELCDQLSDQLSDMTSERDGLQRDIDKLHGEADDLESERDDWKNKYEELCDSIKRAQKDTNKKSGVLRGLPNFPPQTCPLIDSVIATLEEIRAANGTLRDLATEYEDGFNGVEALLDGLEIDK